MDPRIQAALIAAAVTVVGVLLRDLVSATLSHRREQRRSELALFQSYARPIAEASTSLFWRLDEILTSPRSPHYLVDPTTEFERYKLLSTYYRLAALLGWIQGFRRELQYLPVPKREQIEPLKEALRSLERSLADGQGVEERRAREVADLWRLDVPEGDFEQFVVATEKDVKRFLEESQVGSPRDLAEPGVLGLSELLAETAGKFNRGGAVDPQLVAETRRQLVDRITVREGWLYRDWQAGIGDRMIVSAPQASGRAYDVSGFADFEARIRDGIEDDHVWFRRVSRVFDGLDTGGSLAQDARIEQLQSVWLSVARILVVLAEAENELSRQLGNTLRQAREVVASGEAR